MKPRPIIFMSAAVIAATLLSSWPVHADPFGGLFKKKDQSIQNQLPPFNGLKKLLAVMPLEDKVAPTTTATTMNGGGIPAQGGTSSSLTIQPPSDFGTGLTEMLTTELSKTNRYNLLERQNLSDVTGEQKQDADPSFEQGSAPKSGSLLGAQILIRGAVTEYAYSSSGSNTGAQIGTGGGNVVSNTISTAVGAMTGGLLGGGSSPGNNIGGGYSSCKANLTIDLRIIDATTGQIIDSVDGQGSSSSNSFNISTTQSGYAFGTQSFTNSPLGKAVRQAIDSCVYQICMDQNLSSIPWEAQIADMDSSGATINSLYLDAGSNAGVKIGDSFTILKPGRVIKSPQTHVVIGRTKDTVIGHCHIDSLTPDLATASIVDGTGFAVGEIVRHPEDVNALPPGQ